MINVKEILYEIIENENVYDPDFDLIENNHEQLEINSNPKKRNQLIKITTQLNDAEIDILLSMAEQLIKNK